MNSTTLERTDEQPIGIRTRVPPDEPAGKPDELADEPDEAPIATRTRVPKR